jgi:hypothetical protein
VTLISGITKLDTGKEKENTDSKSRVENCIFLNDYF